MTPRFRRVAVFVGTAALAAGAGIGVAASSGDSGTTDRSSNAPGMSQPQDLGGPAAGGGGGLSDVAEQLGVSETRLAEAMRNAQPTDSSAGGGPDAMIKAVADELGLEVDQVREAFEPSLGTAPPQGGSPPPDGAPPTDGQGPTPPAADGQTTTS